MSVADHGGSSIRSAAFSERCEWEKERGKEWIGRRDYGSGSGSLQK